MEITIKQASHNNYFRSENLTREVFWNLFKPGCDEHLVLHNLRKSEAYIPQLDLVACIEGELAGHIISSRAKVIDPETTEYEVLVTGPFSVRQDLQKSGIGSRLMQHMISKARELGYPGVILFGDPNFYHRFGFRNAWQFGISTRDGQNFEPFMALELHEGGLKNIRGRFYEDEVFVTDPEELKKFEEGFPVKQKGEPKQPISLSYK